MRIYFALALLATLLAGGVAFKAHAYSSCQTSCYGNTCYTNCY